MEMVIVESFKLVLRIFIKKLVDYEADNGVAGLIYNWNSARSHFIRSQRLCS